MVDSAKKAFKGVSGLNVSAGSGGGATTVGRFGGSLVGGSASVLGGMMNKTAFLFEKMPKTMFLGTVLTGGLMVRNHYRNKNEASEAEVQAQKMVAQMQYTSPRDYALMQERMRGTGVMQQEQGPVTAQDMALMQARQQGLAAQAPGGLAENVLAARQAGAETVKA